MKGICKVKYNTGDIYEGEYKNGYPNGIGVKIFTKNVGRYEG